MENENALALSSSLPSMFVTPQNKLGKEQISTLRTVKLDRSNATISYNILYKGDAVEIKAPLKGVVVGIYRKYILERFDGNTKVYAFQTSEFANQDWNAEISIIDRTDGAHIKELGKCKSGEFTDWCKKYQQDVLSKELGSVSFVTKIKNNQGEDEVIKAFKVKYVIYMADKDLNIYRFELSGSAYKEIDALMRGFYEVGGGDNFQTYVEVGFSEQKTVKTNTGEYYNVELKAVDRVQDKEEALNYLQLGTKVYATMRIIQNSYESAEIKAEIEDEKLGEFDKVFEAVEAKHDEAREEQDAIKLEDIPF